LEERTMAVPARKRSRSRKAGYCRKPQASRFNPPFHGDILVIQLRNVETGEVVGTISSGQRDFLMEQLEEEFEADRDYYFDANTVAMLEEAGADAELLTVLRTALQGLDGIDLSWSER
jgi:hypothetical protein